MRRFARHLFSLWSAASLLLCVAVCALWVRSYWVADYWVRPTLSEHQPAIRDDYYTEEEYLAGRLIDEYRIASEMGLIWAWHRTAFDTFDQWQPPYFLTDYPQFPPFEETTAIRRLGFAYDNGDGWMVSVPHAAPATAAAIAPAVWLRLWHRRRKRHRHGLCPACGYDLRASPEQCPECGATTAQLGLPA